MRTDDKRKRPGMHTYYNNILILLVLNISMELTFIDYLKTELKNLDDTGADFDRNLMHFPNIVELLCDLLDEDVVDQESRLMINAALGYLLVPNDVVPEDVYGAYGYMDDMYISCVVLINLKKKYSELMTKLWNSKDDLYDALDSCFSAGDLFLTEKNLKEKVLRYCGLSGD